MEKQSSNPSDWEFIPHEIVEDTAMYMSYEDIIHLCVSGFLEAENDICNDKNFWRKRLEYEMEKHRDYIEWMDENSVDIAVIEGAKISRKDLRTLLDNMNKKDERHTIIGGIPVLYDDLRIAWMNIHSKGSSDEITINEATITRNEAYDKSYPSAFLCTTALKKRQWHYVDILVFEYSINWIIFFRDTKVAAPLLDEKYFWHIWSKITNQIHKKLNMTLFFVVAIEDNNLHRLKFMINDSHYPENYNFYDIIKTPVIHKLENSTIKLLFDNLPDQVLDQQQTDKLAQIFLRNVNDNNIDYICKIINLYPYIMWIMELLVSENAGYFEAFVFISEHLIIGRYLDVEIMDDNKPFFLSLPISDKAKEIIRTYDIGSYYP